MVCSVTASVIVPTWVCARGPITVNVCGHQKSFRSSLSCADTGKAAPGNTQLSIRTLLFGSLFTSCDTGCWSPKQTRLVLLFPLCCLKPRFWKNKLSSTYTFQTFGRPGGFGASPVERPAPLPLLSAFVGDAVLFSPVKNSRRCPCVSLADQRERESGVLFCGLPARN